MVAVGGGYAVIVFQFNPTVRGGVLFGKGGSAVHFSQHTELSLCRYCLRWLWCAILFKIPTPLVVTPPRTCISIATSITQAESTHDFLWSLRGEWNATNATNYHVSMLCIRRIMHRLRWWYWKITRTCWFLKSVAKPRSRCFSSPRHSSICRWRGCCCHR